MQNMIVTDWVKERVAELHRFEKTVIDAQQGELSECSRTEWEDCFDNFVEHELWGVDR